MQRIMVQNIDDVLQRGAVLSELESKSLNLTEQSRKYRKDAESLNATSWAVIAGQCSYISSPLILSMIDFMLLYRSWWWYLFAHTVFVLLGLLNCLQ